MARSTFRSQNVQNTPTSDHFWKWRCRKSARRCGEKHVSKSKCTVRAESVAGCVVRRLRRLRRHAPCHFVWQVWHVYGTYGTGWAVVTRLVSEDCVSLRFLRGQRFAWLLSTWRKYRKIVSHQKLHLKRFSIFFNCHAWLRKFCARAAQRHVADSFLLPQKLTDADPLGSFQLLVHDDSMMILLSPHRPSRIPTSCWGAVNRGCISGVGGQISFCNSSDVQLPHRVWNHHYLRATLIELVRVI